MELLENYDFKPQYHPRKTTIVVDALHHEWVIMDNLNEFGFELDVVDSGVFLFNLIVQPALVKKVIEAQLDDDEVRPI